MRLAIITASEYFVWTVPNKIKDGDSKAFIKKEKYIRWFYSV